MGAMGAGVMMIVGAHLSDHFRSTNLKLVSELAMGISVPVHPDAAFTRPAGPDLVKAACGRFGFLKNFHNPAGQKNFHLTLALRIRDFCMNRSPFLLKTSGMVAMCECLHVRQ